MSNPPFFICETMEMLKYAACWEKMANGLEDVVRSQIHGDSELVEDFVREQLYSGVNGDEESLKPTYSQDPYFKENFGRNWKKRAKAYAKWKKSIQPPARSYLGFRPRAMDTPNLIIRGDFYSSITAIPTKDGLMVTSEGVSFATDIERKYTPAIYKIGDKARRRYTKFYVIPLIKRFIKDCGL